MRRWEGEHGIIEVVDQLFGKQISNEPITAPFYHAAERKQPCQPSLPNNCWCGQKETGMNETRTEQSGSLLIKESFMHVVFDSSQKRKTGSVHLPRPFSKFQIELSSLGQK